MIEFARPLYLLLLIPMLYYTCRIAGRSLADMSKFKSGLALGIRVALLVMLIFALADARMVRSVPQQCVIFLLDVSYSIPKADQEAAIDYINNAVKTMNPQQKAGLIVFGGNPLIEFAPGDLKGIGKVHSMPDSGQTNISQALGLALAMFPEQSARKIVLLSDGNETSGKALEQAMLAGSDGVSIDVVPIVSDIHQEVLLDRMICPGSVKIGEPFDLTVVAESREPVLGRIKLIRNGELVDEKTVEIAKGRSTMRFPQSLNVAGYYEFKAILECDDDTYPENNLALASTVVRNKPRVLYVEGEQGQAHYLAEVLAHGDLEVDVRDHSGIPNSLAQLSTYDMLILSDVPAWNLSPEQMVMVNSGVKDLGIGFTMIGGENSFGSGGYYDTPIEEALPVEMTVRKDKVLASLTVVIVIDISGSMGVHEDGVPKIRLASDAAAAVVKMLQPMDHICVIVCDRIPVAAVPLQLTKDKHPIYQQIGSIRSGGGGIAVFPAMKMAYDVISGSDTRQKHIILLADGNDCEDQQGVIPLVNKMRQENITTTAVAIGDGVDVPFLKSVARHGGGHYYLAQRARDLKAIFTTDVMTIAKSLVVEEPFVPHISVESPELSGLSPDSFPQLLGYVATTPKATANVPMVSHNNDPVLATWRYGLGRSAAFTSDCKARWSAHWLSWPDYGKFWMQVLRSTMRKSTPADFQTRVDVVDGIGQVTIDAVDEKGEFLNMLDFDGTVIGPDLKPKPINIAQTGPGSYEAVFEARSTGSYVVNVARKDQEDAQDTCVVNIAYAQEYKSIGPNTPLLKQIASDTSGKFSPKASEVFHQDFREAKAYTDLWRLLVLMSVVLMPIDVAVRRLTVSTKQLSTAYNVSTTYIRRKIKRAPKVEEQQAVVTTLLKEKRVRENVRHGQIADSDLPISFSKPEQMESHGSGCAPEVRTSDEDDASPDMTARLLDAKRRARKQSE